MSVRPAITAAPDDELLARTAAHDVDAFAELFRRHKGMVYRFALHLCGSPAAADDVTQDVFLTVMREAGRYRAGWSGVMPWLCGIARNHARRWLARARTESPTGRGAADHAEPAFSGMSPLEELTRGERLSEVRRAVLALPIRYREVVVLCDLQELTYAQAAAALGCAVGTVRSRLHRGRGLIEAKLTARMDAGCLP